MAIFWGIPPGILPPPREYTEVTTQIDDNKEADMAKIEIPDIPLCPGPKCGCFPRPFDDPEPVYLTDQGSMSNTDLYIEAATSPNSDISSLDMAIAMA